MAPALDRLCREATEAVHAGHNILILSDRAVFGRAGADPGFARDLGGAPSPDPPGSAHLDRHRRRDRRGARGAPFLRARRLWRGGDQPLSRLCHPRADPRRERAAAQRRARCRRTTSRRSARGSSKSSPRWGSRPTSPIAARRSSTPSGWRAISSRNTSPARRRRSRASGCERSPRRRCSGTGTPMATTRSTTTCSIVGGDYAFRLRGEDHAWTPQSVAKLQHAVRGNSLGRLPGLCRRRSTTRASGC